MFVPTSSAAVAANTEDTRFGDLAAESEWTSLLLHAWRIREQGIAALETLQPQALAEDVKFARFRR